MSLAVVIWKGMRRNAATDSANKGASLFVFEDNDPVIKKVMQGRSPSVNLDWLFVRRNLDPGT